MREWRPRLRHGQVSIRRKGRLYALVCRSNREANYLQEAIISAFAMFRQRLSPRAANIGDDFKSEK
jgi:hypothetical protein